MYHEIWAGGKESEDVQFRSSRSPISYSASKFPVICGPSFGKSENIDPEEEASIKYKSFAFSPSSDDSSVVELRGGSVSHLLHNIPSIYR
jgi:hypothetical protein